MDIADIVVRNKTPLGAVSALTCGVHFNVSLDPAGLVAVAPIGGAMPSAPSTLLIERVTPATQETDFQNL